jgi:transcriptional regulator with XRE-family HTH domain
VAKSIGRVIRELREEVGLSRAALARAAKLDPAALAHIEKEERRELRFTTICRLSVALGIPTDEIAARAGLIRPNSVGRSKPNAKMASMAASIEALEPLLSKASRHAERLKKLATDR